MKLSALSQVLKEGQQARGRLVTRWRDAVRIGVCECAFPRFSRFIRRLIVIGAAKKSDVIDTTAFLAQHPVGAQHVERVKPFAVAAFDQRNGEGFTFAEDAHGTG